MNWPKRWPRAFPRPSGHARVCRLAGSDRRDPRLHREPAIQMKRPKPEATHRAATDGPSRILLALPSQAKFAETAALRYAVELAAGCNASLSLYVFPSATQPRSARASGSEANTANRRRSPTLEGASRFISQAGVELVVRHSPPDTRLAQLARVHTITVIDMANAAQPSHGRHRGRPVRQWPPRPRRPAKWRQTGTAAHRHCLGRQRPRRPGCQ